MVMKIPGNISELNEVTLESWTTKLSKDFREQIAFTREIPAPDQQRAWFFDAALAELTDVLSKDISWTAYPKKFKQSQWVQVDANRDLQEEYCEWEVVRQGNRLVRITFTTETPDYYRFLWENDPPKLLELYQRYVSPGVLLKDLGSSLLGYNPRNNWNLPTTRRGTIMHMAQDNNTLGAAMNLAAAATWPVVDEKGVPVISEPGLIAALHFGDKDRHSDPHIGAQINELVRAGNEVSFADPVGLYIDDVDLAGFELPGDMPATQLMKVTRGSDGFVMRVVFEVPSDAGFDLDEVKIDDRPLRTGSQIAEKIKVRVRGIARPTDQAAPRLQLPGLTVVGVALDAAVVSDDSTRMSKPNLSASVRARIVDGIRSPELEVATAVASNGDHRTAIARTTPATQLLPMRIQVLAGSLAEHKHYVRVADASSKRGDVWASPLALAPGLAPAPAADLVYRGGKTVPQMEFQNIYLGGKASWKEVDTTSIDRAINLAMRDKRLNNVMKQYFLQQALDCSMRDSIIHQGKKPTGLDESDVQALVIALFDSGAVRANDLDTCVFNLILPQGTTLSLNDASSLEGLGGYHGSTHVMRGGKRITLYYSANVYSMPLDAFRQNGIVAFNQPWKNVVATLYHELNEFRTDPDVNDAILNSDNGFCGWTSLTGQEVGDQPIFRAGSNLELVFQEVESSNGISLPVQFMYSNNVHGAEGPVG